MFNLHFSINNPWAKEDFKNLFSRSGVITKNKAWEFEIIKHSYTLVELNIRYTVKQDHAGFNLVIGIGRYAMHFQIYDGRHWDYEHDCWEVYKE
jgi:hypothetical protein